MDWGTRQISHQKFWYKKRWVEMRSPIVEVMKDPCYSSLTREGQPHTTGQEHRQGAWACEAFAEEACTVEVVQLLERVWELCGKVSELQVSSTGSLPVTALTHCSTLRPAETFSANAMMPDAETDPSEAKKRPIKPAVRSRQLCKLPLHEGWRAPKTLGSQNCQLAALESWRWWNSWNQL